MRTILGIGILCLAETLFAEVVPATGTVALLPTPTVNSAILRRDKEQQCSASISSALSPPAPNNTRLLESVTTSDCAITAPAALSSDVLSYLSVLDTHFPKVFRMAGNHLKSCGPHDLTYVDTLYSCTPSITLLFTDAASQTSTKLILQPTGLREGVVISASPGKLGPSAFYIPLVAGMALQVLWL